MFTTQDALYELAYDPTLDFVAIWTDGNDNYIQGYVSDGGPTASQVMRHLDAFGIPKPIGSWFVTYKDQTTEVFE